MSNASQPLIDTVHRVVEKIRKTGNLSADKYFMVKDPKVLPSTETPQEVRECSMTTCFFELWILYRKHNSFSTFSLETPDTWGQVLHKRHLWFSKKLCSLTDLLSDIILCSVNAVGLYPNIWHDEGLSALQIRLELRRERKE